MKCFTWNLEWTSPSSKRGSLVREVIADVDPDVACYTEINRDLAPDGHTIEANEDYGYPHSGNRRKVILWSRQPWTQIDVFGDSAMPRGRFASAVTQGIRFVGFCIPWKDAHVRSGRRDREPWEDHLAYCSGLARILAELSRKEEPVCVIGDFNQRIPRVTQPEHVAQSLMEAIPSNFSIATEGMKDPEKKNLVDHVAGCSRLSISVDRIVSRFAPCGTRLSDHPGVVATVASKNEEGGNA